MVTHSGAFVFSTHSGLFLLWLLPSSNVLSWTFFPSPPSPHPRVVRSQRARAFFSSTWRRCQGRKAPSLLSRIRSKAVQSFSSPLFSKWIPQVNAFPSASLFIIRWTCAGDFPRFFYRDSWRSLSSFETGAGVSRASLGPVTRASVGYVIDLLPTNSLLLLQIDLSEE